jgi:hypothetical protein
MSESQLMMVAVIDKGYCFQAKWDAAFRTYYEYKQVNRIENDEPLEDYLKRVGYLLKEDWLMYYLEGSMTTAEAYAKLEELRAELKRKEGEE